MDRIERIRQSFFTRKLEHSDTDDHINRHDPDYHKNNPKKHDHHHGLDDNDLTDISVESLIIFLQGLKRDKDTSAQTPENKPVDEAMKKAISAYSHATPAPKKQYTYLDDAEQDVDIAVVDHLIESLTAIRDKGIAHITLIQSNGFLQSIEKTVAKFSSLD